jgi:hypothetical protein
MKLHVRGRGGGGDGGGAGVMVLIDTSIDASTVDLISHVFRST